MAIIEFKRPVNHTSLAALLCLLVGCVVVPPSGRPYPPPAAPPPGTGSIPELPAPPPPPPPPPGHSNVTTVVGAGAVPEVPMELDLYKKLPPQTVCRNYADRAVAAQRANQARHCGVSGQEWNVNPDFHYQVCMSSATSSSTHAEALRAERLRTAALQKCH
jgi:hypothetical protein